MDHCADPLSSQCPRRVAKKTGEHPCDPFHTSPPATQYWASHLVAPGAIFHFRLTLVLSDGHRWATRDVEARERKREDQVVN